MAILVVYPTISRGIVTVMPPMRARCQPNLRGGTLAADDETCSIRKFYSHNAVAGIVVSLIRIELLEPICDASQARIGACCKIVFLVHGVRLGEPTCQRGPFFRSSSSRYRRNRMFYSGLPSTTPRLSEWILRRTTSSTASPCSSHPEINSRA